MSHLDEGTIHAWLDGALPADEAARVEAHARDCADCSAMVAEARGFIAGASRIVSSLDIVRGDVIPSAAGAPVKPAPRASLWRALKLTPARAAIAATLLVAVGSMFTLRHQDMELPAPAARVVADSLSTPLAPAAAPAPLPERVDTTAAKSARAADAAPENAGGVKRQPVAKPGVASGNSGLATGVPPVATPLAASAERKVAVAPAAVAPAPVPSAAASAPVPARRTLRDTTMRLDEVVVTSASEPARRDSTAAQRANASAARAGASGATTGDAASRMTRLVAVPPAAIEARVPGCYRLQFDPPMDLRGFPAQFRLARDSTTGGHYVYAINVDRDSVLNGAGWRVLGTTVIVAGTDARFGSVQVSFPADSARATFRSMVATVNATIQRMSCTR